MMLVPLCLATASPPAAAAGATPALAALDWIIVAAYLGGVLALGAIVGRRQKSTDEYFRGSNRMPMFAVAVSVLATSLSAATFIGGPQQAFRGDLTYLAASLGGIFGAIIVAAIFIPAFYRAGVTTVYELLEKSFGSGGRMAASGMFQVGRIFASGARLFMAAIPVALIFFMSPGDALGPASLIPAILIVALVATVYTAIGGIKAVIWTDLAQTIILVSAAVVGALVLLDRIPLDLAGIYDTLAATPVDPADPDSPSKLRLLNLDADLNSNYSLLAILIGMTLFNVAAYGTDQDLTQRMLTCRNARAGSASMILSQLFGLVTVSLFMGLGLLLYVYYRRPDVMGEGAPAAVDDGREVFLSFILGELPAGVRGLLMAGLFAAAMSSLDSALNAMSSAFVCDIYRPLRPGRDDRHYVRVSRVAVGGWAVALAGFACLCTWWQAHSGATLIDFALGVMVFAYGGLLGVFIAALCGVRRGPAAAIAALIAGFMSVAAMRFGPQLIPQLPTLAFSWQMAAATLVSLAVCVLWPRGSSAWVPPPSRGGVAQGTADNQMGADGADRADDDIPGDDSSGADHSGSDRTQLENPSGHVPPGTVGAVGVPSPPGTVGGTQAPRDGGGTQRRPMTARELERLAGRCLMVGIRGSGAHDAAFREDLEACREAQVGGVILFDVHAPEMARLVARGVAPEEARRRAGRNIESPAQLRELIGLLRETLGPELLVAIDQEGGAVARLGPGRGFPATISAAEFARLAPEAQRAAAAELVRPLAEAGIDTNFAPCVDVAVDAEGMIARAQRSFGVEAETVIGCARAVIEAHAAAGVTPCLKHFPGHGSARADSHAELPEITGSHLREVELAPYHALAAPALTSEQVSGTGDPKAPMVMTGHLLHRGLDSELPASLSPAITTGLLRQKVGFEGVIVTDSLDMRAIRDRWDAPTAAVMALRAGADIALDAHNLPAPDGSHAERPCEAVAMRDAIARAAGDGGLDPELLAASAARVAQLVARRR